MYKNILIVILLFAGQYLSAQVLTLEECKKYAIENNKRLKEAHLKIDAAKEVKDNAYTNYFPHVEAGALAMKSADYLIETEIPEMNLPVYDGNPINLRNPTQFTYFPGMSLELVDYANAAYIMAAQPIYAGGRISNGNKLASLAIELNEENLKLNTESALVKTEEYFWQLTSLKAKKNTLISYEQMLNSLQKDVSVAFEAGLIQKSDLLKVQLEKNKIKMNMIKLDNGLDLLKMALAQHIGVEYNDEFDISAAEIRVGPPETVFRKPQEALGSRTEVDMLKKAIEAEELQRSISKGEHLPQLAVAFQGYYLDVMDMESTNFIGMATLSVPISGWWGGSHKLQEHDIKIDIAKNNLAEKTELMRLQIEKTFKDLTESYKQISIAEETKKQAESTLGLLMIAIKPDLLRHRIYLRPRQCISRQKTAC